MKIDINKKYRTSDAKWPVTIVSVNGPYPGFPVVGYAHSSSVPLLSHWTEDGGYPANTHLNLIEVREPREFWINIYPGNGTALHPTFESAEAGKNGGFASVETIRVREIIG